LKAIRFESKRGRFDFKGDRFERETERFKPKINRFELKTERFDLRIDVLVGSPGRSLRVARRGGNPLQIRMGYEIAA
jgi:hypothetical protein